MLRTLSECATGTAADASLLALFTRPADIVAWLARWRARLALERPDGLARSASMRRANPAYIPRNHQIERMIAAAIDGDDFAPFETLCEVLSAPFEPRPQFADYALAPQPAERVLQTFCGT